MHNWYHTSVNYFGFLVFNQKRRSVSDFHVKIRYSYKNIASDWTAATRQPTKSHELAVTKWKRILHYWVSVRELHRLQLDSPHKGQWCGVLMFWCWVEQAVEQTVDTPGIRDPMMSLSRRGTSDIHRTTFVIMMVALVCNKRQAVSWLDCYYNVPWTLARYVKLRVAHAPVMPGTFPPPPRVSNPNMHHGTCVTYVPWCMPGSLTSGFNWSRWRGKHSRHSRRMRNPQFYVSDKRPTNIELTQYNNTGYQERSRGRQPDGFYLSVCPIHERRHPGRAGVGDPIHGILAYPARVILAAGITNGPVCGQCHILPNSLFWSEARAAAWYKREETNDIETWALIQYKDDILPV